MNNFTDRAAIARVILLENAMARTASLHVEEVALAENLFATVDFNYEYMISGNYESDVNASPNIEIISVDPHVESVFDGNGIEIVPTADHVTLAANAFWESFVDRALNSLYERPALGQEL